MVDLVKFWRSGPTIFANSGLRLGKRGDIWVGKEGLWLVKRWRVMVGEKVEGYGWVKGGWLLVGKGEGYG